MTSMMELSFLHSKSNLLKEGIRHESEAIWFMAFFNADNRIYRFLIVLYNLYIIEKGS